MEQVNKQGIAGLVPRGSTPRLLWVQTLDCQSKLPKGKGQSRNTRAGNEFARQGIPFGQFVQA